MTDETIELAPVDEVQVTTLYDNLVDQMLPAGDGIERLSPEHGTIIVSSLLSEEKRVPFVGGHGFATVVTVTHNGVRRSLLFDAGGSPDGLMHNLDCLEIQPKDWSCIVLSHGHWDHTLGLIGVHQRVGRLAFPLTLHPDAYLTRMNIYPDGHQSRTVPPSRQGLRDAGLDLIETERPSFVLDGMVLVTGQVARTNSFETGSPPHHAVRNGVVEPDPLICDDQALVINVRNKGLVVLTGCGHAGIINTIEYAQSITQVPTVHAVIGGFHLGPETFQARVRPVVESLVRLNPALIAPTHCTGYRAMFGVYQALPDAYVQNGVGTRIALRAGPRDLGHRPTRRSCMITKTSGEANGHMDTTQTRRLNPGEPAPDFRLPSTRGTQVALSEFRGRKHVVLAFLRGMT